MTLQSRLLGVFAQYPDPRVGVLTAEVVVARLRGASAYLGWGHAYSNRTGSSGELPGLVQARCDIADLEKPLTIEERASFWKLPPLLDAEDAHIVGTYWIDMLRQGKYYDDDVVLTEPTKYDVLVPWIARLVAAELRLVRKGEKSAGALYRTIWYWPRYLSEVADWAHATHPNIMPLTLNQVLRRTWTWHKELARQESAKAAVVGTVVYRFEDGWTVQQLTTVAQLKSESAMMRHCVGHGGYYEAVQRGALAIFSIRDTRGLAKVTLEVSSGHVRQAKLHANRLPHTHDICDRILEAAYHLGWRVDNITDTAKCFEMYYPSCFAHLAAQHVHQDSQIPDYMKEFCEYWYATDASAFIRHGRPL